MSQETSGDSGVKKNRAEKLNDDIDWRLSDLMLQAFNEDNWDMESIIKYLRAAYGKGYIDAIQEPSNLRGKLCSDHGYSIPEPKDITEI